MQSTLELHTLSTGRAILAGIHCYSSIVRADGTEMDRSEWVALTDAEQDEAWAIVNERCRAHRAAKAAA